MIVKSNYKIILNAFCKFLIIKSITKKHFSDVVLDFIEFFFECDRNKIKALNIALDSKKEYMIYGSHIDVLFFQIIEDLIYKYDAMYDRNDIYTYLLKVYYNKFKIAVEKYLQ